MSAAVLLALAGTTARAQPLKSDDPRPPAAPRQEAGGLSPSAAAAVEAFEDRPIREVRIVGLAKTDVQLVRNNIRSRVGSPLDAQTVRGDVLRLNRLGRFRGIEAKVQGFDDGTVLLTYELSETPIITAVDITGNRQISNADIAPLISLLKGTPVDEYQLGAARAAIERLYRDKGYFQATVTINQEELEKTGTVLFQVTEGERVRVTDIRFEGNRSFEPSQLDSAIKSTTAGLFDDGPVDNERLDRDVASLIEFYRDRGYLDVRADRQVIFSPNGREAIIKFIIDEGPLYTLRSVVFNVVAAPDDALGPGEDDLGDAEPDATPRPPSKPVGTYSRPQIAGLMEIKVGDVYSVKNVRNSIDSVRNAYTRLGFTDVQVGRTERRNPDAPEVDLIVTVREGRPYLTGLINVKGNELTKDSVIFRNLNIKPDRPLDLSTKRVGERTTTDAEQRLTETRLFEPGSVRLTVQPPAPDDPEHRDVLIEVRETNTGSLSFGAGVNSDLGVVASVSLTQRNFDIADVPDSFGEFFAGRAFRGAGQDFNLTIAPGTETQNYSISLSDPALFDTDYTGSIAAYYRVRNYSQFDQSTLGSRIGFGRRFGEQWVGTLAFRADNIDITDIESDAPVDLVEVEGTNLISSVGVTFTRTTVDSRYRPTRGSRLSLGVEQFGTLVGDYSFTRLNIDHSVFFPIYENYLGYKTVFSLKTDVGYIPQGQNSAPLYERFYRGGTSFRGFEFRTISPKGIVASTGEVGDTPVGGAWMFFIGPEIIQPVYKDIVSVVGFIDTGTVTENAGFAQYRVSAGVGLRINLEMLGPVPIALDFGFPIIKYFGDVEHVVSFSIDVPF